MNISRIDRFVELVSSGMSSSSAVPIGVTKAFSNVLDGPTRMNYLSAARVHRCLPTMLSCWSSWRTDPAVRKRLRTILPEYHSRTRLEMILFVAEPQDEELEQLFCEAVRECWDAEMKSIREYVDESCGGSDAHFDEEVGGAHLSLFPVLIAFAAFGYTRQFEVIPRIPSQVGPAIARYQQFVEPMVRGSETLRIALEHLLPKHVLPQPAPEKLIKLDDPMSLSFPETQPNSQSAAAESELTVLGEEEERTVYQQLLDTHHTHDRRRLLESLGRSILKSEFRGIIPVLLRDESEQVATLIAGMYLRDLAEKTDHLSAINHALTLSYQVPQPKVFGRAVFELVNAYGQLQ